MSDLPVQSFKFDAMHTTFVVRLCDGDAERSRQMAGNCWRLLESLESELSRFRQDSEITRINRMQAGEQMRIADATNRCLRLALKATTATAGLFDVTLGALTWEHVKCESRSPVGRLVLDPDRPLITCEEAGREIDLGGIGKGFALDEMAANLRELGATGGLLSSGASTHLAFGEGNWPIHLRQGAHSESVGLRLAALSASGTGIQGAHVVHPDTGEPADYVHPRIWVIAPSAALADAYSTACLLMQEEELKDFADSLDDSIAIYAGGAEGICKA